MVDRTGLWIGPHEKWIVIPPLEDVPEINFKGKYSITSCGEVFRHFGNKEKHKMSVDKTNGYQRVRLSDDGVQIHFSVHTLLVYAFKPWIAEYSIPRRITYRDGDRNNLSLNNLTFLGDFPFDWKMDRIQHYTFYRLDKEGNVWKNQYEQVRVWSNGYVSMFRENGEYSEKPEYLQRLVL